MTWHGERKRHSDVQLRYNLREILRQPIQIVKKIEDKGYPTSDSDYLPSHKLAEAAEKSIFGTDSFNRLEKIIQDELPEGQLLGTHTPGKPIQVSSVVPAEFIPEVVLHEAVETKAMNADGGTDIDLFVTGKSKELIQNGKPIAIRTKDFVFITKDFSPNQIPELYKKLNTTYSGGSVSLGLKDGHVIVKNIDEEIKKHEQAAAIAGNDISKRMHVQILKALKKLNIVNEYQCPKCKAMNSMFPAWAGRRRFYRCEKCEIEYSSKTLDKAWGRDSKKQPNPLSVVKEG